MPFVLPEEMRVVAGVGVEIAATAVNRDLLDQPGIAEGAQRIVDRGQRHALALGLGRSIEALGGDVPVLAVAHQQRRQRDALSRGPEPRLAQPVAASLNGVARHSSVQCPSSMRRI